MTLLNIISQIEEDVNIDHSKNIQQNINYSLTQNIQENHLINLYDNLSLPSHQVFLEINNKHNPLTNTNSIQ